LHDAFKTLTDEIIHTHAPAGMEGHRAPKGNRSRSPSALRALANAGREEKPRPITSDGRDITPAQLFNRKSEAYMKF